VHVGGTEPMGKGTIVFGIIVLFVFSLWLGYMYGSILPPINEQEGVPEAVITRVIVDRPVYINNTIYRLETRVIEQNRTVTLLCLQTGSGCREGVLSMKVKCSDMSIRDWIC
jgi:hypothetical protein